MTESYSALHCCSIALSIFSGGDNRADKEIACHEHQYVDFTHQEYRPRLINGGENEMSNLDIKRGKWLLMLLTVLLTFYLL